MSKKVKIFVIVVGIIIILIWAFSSIGNSPSSSDNAALSSSASTVLPGGGGPITSDQNSVSFSGLLSSISSINLDISLFSNPGYLALRDNPVVLGTAIIGRPNPFAPLGSDSATPQQLAPLQVQTLAPGKIVSTSAELGALITATSTVPISVIFHYDTSDQLGLATTPITVTKNGTALFTLSGLAPSTTYYVEAVAVQGSNTTTGSIMSFTTAPAQNR